MTGLPFFVEIVVANLVGQVLGAGLIWIALRGYWQASARWQQAQDDERT